MAFSLEFLKFNFAFAFNGQKIVLFCFVFQFDNIRGHSRRPKPCKRRSGEDRIACIHELCYSCPVLNQAQWLYAHSF